MAAEGFGKSVYIGGLVKEGKKRRVGINYGLYSMTQMGKFPCAD